MANHGITVFLCDEKHLPNSQILPINQYCRQRKLLMAQYEMSRPLQKQLCQQFEQLMIFLRKIRNDFSMKSFRIFAVLFKFSKEFANKTTGFAFPIFTYYTTTREDWDLRQS